MENVIVFILYMIALVDLINIFKRKNKRLIITYIVIFAFSFIIINLYYFGVHIPSLSMAIKKLITSIF